MALRGTPLPNPERCAWFDLEESFFLMLFRGNVPGGASINCQGSFMKSFRLAMFSSAFLTSLAMAQSAPPAPSAQSNQLTPKVLAEMLQSASTFHDLVQNLNKGLGPDVHTPGPDGSSQHSVERTAITVGAGAGVGAAIGGMTRNQNGLLIGALIGSAGGLVLDEILKHREQTHPQPASQASPQDAPVLKRRPPQ
jgi:hypothetical protein